MDDEAKAILREIRDLTANQVAMVEKMLDRHLGKVQSYYNESGERSEHLYKKANEEYALFYQRRDAAWRRAQTILWIVFSFFIFIAVALGVFVGVVAGHKWLPF